MYECIWNGLWSKVLWAIRFKTFFKVLEVWVILLIWQSRLHACARVLPNHSNLKNSKRFLINIWRKINLRWHYCEISNNKRFEFFASLAMLRASSNVQQLWTPGRSRPGTGGLMGRAPVAMSNLSNPREAPLSSTNDMALASTLATRSRTISILSSSKWRSCFRM